MSYINQFDQEDIVNADLSGTYSMDENEYKELMKTMPKAIDWSKLKDFEKEDTTNGSKELACTAGVCEVVDIEAT